MERGTHRGKARWGESQGHTHSQRDPKEDSAEDSAESAEERAARTAVTQDTQAFSHIGEKRKESPKEKEKLEDTKSMKTVGRKTQ